MTTAREEYLLKSTSFRPSYPEITTEQAVILKRELQIEYVASVFWIRIIKQLLDSAFVWYEELCIPLGKCYRLSCQIRAILHIIRRTYQKIVIYHYCYLYYYDIIIIGLELVFRASSVSLRLIYVVSRLSTNVILSASPYLPRRGAKNCRPSHTALSPFLFFWGVKEPMTAPTLLFVESRDRGPWWGGVRLCECIAVEVSISLKWLFEGSNIAWKNF